MRARAATVVVPGETPVTPLPRRRIPVVYSPEVGFGRLVIDEGPGNATEPATTTDPATTVELDISWLYEQQTRLNFPPAHPGSKQ